MAPALRGTACRAGPGPETRPDGLGTGGSASKPVRRTLAWGGVHRAGGVHTGPRSASAQGGRHHQWPCSIARFPPQRQVAGWPRGAHSAGACRQSGERLCTAWRA